MIFKYFCEKRRCFDLNLDFLQPVKVQKIGPKTSGCDFDRAIEYDLEHGSSKNVTSSEELTRVQCLSYVRKCSYSGKKSFELPNKCIVGGYAAIPQT